MSIAAGACHSVRLATLLAGVKGNAELTGLAILNAPHGLELVSRHAGSEFLPISFAVELKDFSDRGHDGSGALAHQPSNLIDGRLFAVGSHVQVHRGRLQAGMAQILLNEPQVDA